MKYDLLLRYYASRPSLHGGGKALLLRWDPQQELVVADDEANRLLDRPRRKGWELP